MTQAPATPELVERLREHVRYKYMPAAARLAMEQAADALEAQQARIAELEGLLKSLRLDWSALTNTGSAIAKINVRLIDQALSSQGRHEGGEDGLPESPGVNAVPLPASPDGPSQMDRVWAAVNVLGAPDTACTSDEDRAYCRAIGDALSEIEKLGGRPQ